MATVFQAVVEENQIAVYYLWHSGFVRSKLLVDIGVVYRSTFLKVSQKSTLDRLQDQLVCTTHRRMAIFFGWFDRGPMMSKKRPSVGYSTSDALKPLLFRVL